MKPKHRYQPGDEVSRRYQVYQTVMGKTRAAPFLTQRAAEIWGGIDSVYAQQAQQSALFLLRRIYQPAEDSDGGGGLLGQVSQVLHPFRHQHCAQAVAEGRPALPPHAAGVVPVGHQVHARVHAAEDPCRDSTYSRLTQLHSVATETVAASLV